MDFKTVPVQIPDGTNIILGQTHFIKTAEDLYEILVGSSPHIKFGVAFTEASGPCLIRYEGNEDGLAQKAAAIVQEPTLVIAFFIRFIDGSRGRVCFRQKIAGGGFEDGSYGQKPLA